MFLIKKDNFHTLGGEYLIRTDDHTLGGIPTDLICPVQSVLHLGHIARNNADNNNDDDFHDA